MSQAQSGLESSLGGQKHLAGKYLTFMLSEEQYGLRILKVQEIIGVMKTTRVPGSPHYVKGVINLRGKIIPVVDLRLKFGLPELTYDDRTCVIVVEAELAGRGVAVGVIVDTVLEVINLESAKIEQSPNYGTNLDTKFVLGMARSPDNRVIILIDGDQALKGAEVVAAVQMGA